MTVPENFIFPLVRRCVHNFGNEDYFRSVASLSARIEGKSHHWVGAVANFDNWVCSAVKDIDFCELLAVWLAT